MIHALGVSILSAFILAAAPASADDFHGCPPEGSATGYTRADPSLNRLKNREADPSAYDAATFDQVLVLPSTGSSRAHRDKWEAAALTSIQNVETKAISLEGYLRGVKLEDAESPNCGSDEQADRDFHIWLSTFPEAGKEDSMVVEVTPRIRSKHAAWSTRNLNRFVRSGARMRISGWLMLDPEHPDQVGATRKTLWEIHPVMKIEVWSENRWREL